MIVYTIRNGRMCSSSARIWPLPALSFWGYHFTVLQTVIDPDSCGRRQEGTEGIHTVSTRFSLLVPYVQSGRELLRETIDSVNFAVPQELQLIVIDDGSTDGTWDMLKSYGTRLRALRQSNQGRGGGAQFGAAHATGEYLVLLDSDDLLMPHALATYDQVVRAYAIPRPGHRISRRICDGSAATSI